MIKTKHPACRHTEERGQGVRLGGAVVHSITEEPEALAKLPKKMSAVVLNQKKGTTLYMPVPALQFTSLHHRPLFSQQAEYN